eukprot:c12516_g1_i1.p2 GENE.c12516_g1_i1~~c12516_g1_i1.p2  ORF type:complete len:170 (+),score=39.22 c12516_g1_i1:472-981(+)
MDKWGEEQRKRMLDQGGNNKVNSVLEAHPNTDTHKPTPTSSIETKHAYIANKYQAREFEATGSGKPTIEPAPPTSTPSGKHFSLGQVHVGLLIVRVIRGLNLKAADIGGASDPYVKVSSGENKGKTGIVFKTVSPVWNQVLTLNIDDINTPILFKVQQPIPFPLIITFC